LGHDAYSCDIIESDDNSKFHFQQDVFEAIASQHWDMMIAHPPCTYLCSSGLHWNTRCNPDGELTEKAQARLKSTEEALEFVTSLWNADIKKVCIENPVGCINTRLPFMPKPQYIQPYDYGHDASKRTGLWMRGLPNLVPYAEDKIEPRIVTRNGKQYYRWANQTPGGQDSTPPSANRGKDRAKTYNGIAWAMVEAWNM
jgi:hypothetical protein